MRDWVPSDERKRKELQEKRERGGRFLQLGPNGGVQYSEWTCEWCGQTLRGTHATMKVALHRVNCSERPHADQATLEDVGVTS